MEPRDFPHLHAVKAQGMLCFSHGILKSANTIGVVISQDLLPLQLDETLPAVSNETGQGQAEGPFL